MRTEGTQSPEIGAQSPEKSPKYSPPVRVALGLFRADCGFEARETLTLFIFGISIGALAGLHIIAHAVNQLIRRGG